MTIASFRAAALLFAALIAGCNNWSGFGFNASGPEMSRLKEALALKPRMVVADVGAGKGQLTRALAETVGPGGHVFATEIDPGRLKTLRAMLAEAELGHVTVVEAKPRNSGLAAGCCDAIVLRRVYHHVTSTGMISHVGPRGLVPYVREVRRRILGGGRYLHHALMTRHSRWPLDANVGIAFNKRYVWPGFHWFTVGEHVRALEGNGFQVERLVNLTRHYAKTTTAWYERMMEHRDTMREFMDEATFRAWQVFLAGITGSYLNRDVHVYRLYCVAT